MAKSSQVNKLKRRDEITAVEMAVNAVTGDSNVMDMPMADFDPSPGALGLSRQGSSGKVLPLRPPRRGPLSRMRLAAMRGLHCRMRRLTLRYCSLDRLNPICFV